MRKIELSLSTVAFSLCLASALQAQDTRRVSEPKLPPVCAVIHAPLESTPTGPVVGDTVAQQDAISDEETNTITSVFGKCSSRAIELALGSDVQHDAFLIDPITFPSGVSLIIDGGVTVYGSRDPVKYQILNSPNGTCGTLAIFDSKDAADEACQGLLTFAGNSAGEANSGLYGYGVVDGQGQLPMLFSTPPSAITPEQCRLTNHPTSPTWWDLINAKDNCSIKKEVNENSPYLVSAGAASNTGGNFILYQVTLRNPPFHNANLGGIGITVWGIRIQAPWDIPNTDGLNLHGSQITVYDTIVSNGDDDITFATGNSNTTDITVKRFAAYSRDGITIFGNGTGTLGVSNLRIEDVTLTGDLPSVVSTAVNGVDEDTIKSQYNVVSYARALPNAAGDVNGLNIKWNGGSRTTGVTLRNACLQDIETPLNIIQQDTSTVAPTLNAISFENVHVLAPTSQFVTYSGANNGEPGSGRYYVNFYGASSGPAEFTLSNLVFDDLADGGGTPLAAIDAQYDSITTARNVYPAVFNLLDGSGAPPALPVLDIVDNTYSARAVRSTPWLANPCRASLPFITGELYATTGSVVATGNSSGSDPLVVDAGSTFTLNAVVQPIMSQTSYAMPGKNPPDDNVVAIASPSLTNRVRLYDGHKYVGSAALSANGTLVSFEISSITPGWHFYSAQYPQDRFYSGLNFGSIIVYAAP